MIKSSEKTKRAYAMPGTVTHKAFIVWYREHEERYFAHARTLAHARSIINEAHCRVRGYVNLRSRRFHALDDRVITNAALRELGYRLQNPKKATKSTQICHCELCQGGKDAKDD